MSTGHRGSINLNVQEREDFDYYRQCIDVEIKRRRANPHEPQPVTFDTHIPRAITDQTIESLRAYYRPTFGVKTDHTKHDVWVLSFTSHT